MNFANTHIPGVGLWDMWVQGAWDAPPQLHRCFHIHLLPHPQTKGGCFPHSPAAGMCPGRSPWPRCSHPKLALLEFKCAGMSWGTRRGDCADTSPARGVLVPLSGALQTLWSWEGKIPAGIIPPQHGRASPCCQTPLWYPWGCVGRGRSVPEPAEPRVSAAALVSWSRRDSSWGPAKTNPFVPVRISDWALQHPQSRGGGEDAQTHSSALPCLCPSRTSSGAVVSELWWENRGWGCTG